MFNSNLWHNILNIAIAVQGAALAFFIATGCTSDPTGMVTECSQSWINPEITTISITVMAFLKSTINVFRDGFSGLFKTQPPVQ